ncbi:MAG: hypothetical protein OWS74_01820, partial [Firmicutes bacterium]|nr:hypothetical protein [Bacillota bacterium]
MHSQGIRLAAWAGLAAIALSGCGQASAPQHTANKQTQSSRKSVAPAQHKTSPMAKKNQHLKVLAFY